MTPDSTNIRSIISDVCLITACDQVRDGSLRLATPFFYPDGSHIDVFLKLGGSDELFFELSDKGQTMAYLLDLHVKPWTSQKRKQTLADICATLGVKQEGGAFLIQIKQSEMKDLPDAMLRLAQVCIRVADLAYTQRLRSTVALTEDFEEFIVGLDRPYQPGVKIPGQFGKEVEFNFLVEGQRMRSLVQILSTANQSAAHILSVDAFARWSDIAPVRHQYQCLSVYDTSNDVFREDDLKRLQVVSDIVGFPAESDRLNLSLAA
jgi:hypothetical protein